MSSFVTGARGFLGTALCHALRMNGEVIFTRPHGEAAQPIHPSVTTVYHLAAQTSAYAAQAHPLMDLASNLTEFVALLEELRHLPQSPFLVFASTATIAGVVPTLPITEQTPADPTTFYDVSKFCAEQYLLQYIREGWLRGCILRFTNIYGPCPPSQAEDRGIVNKLVARAKAGQALTCYGTGEYWRDYLYLDDAVTALRAATAFPIRTSGRMFYVAAGRSMLLRDVFELVKRLVNPSIEIQTVPVPPGLYPIEWRHVQVNPAAFEAATYWRAEWTVEDGIREMAAR